MAWIVCRVGFLPCHNVCQATSYDGRSVQVVAMFADSESRQQRQFSRFNLGACHATIIDTITSGHEAQAVNEGTTGHEAQAVNEGTTSGFANVVKKIQVGLMCCCCTHDIKDSTHTVRYYPLDDSALQ
jgi:hypothetical protein